MFCVPNVLIILVVFFIVSVLVNALWQIFCKDINEPPVVFHWIPILGSTIEYGIQPEDFLVRCRQKYGDVFTFILLGRKTTVCLGTKGNEFILNGKLSDVNAEEVYRNLTTPVFGEDVVYDVPNAKMMQQKKFLKYGITSEKMRTYVPLMISEFDQWLSTSDGFKGARGSIDITKAIAELTIFTASRTLQGKEVRCQFDSSFAKLYHDLDMGFAPINFIAPWLPLPANQRRDRAQKRIARVYMNIIEERRDPARISRQHEEDMIWHLMSCRYKDGTMLPDKEIAHIMIALLMAGQHSSSSVGAWIILRLATRPDIQEQLYAEQRTVLGSGAGPPRLPVYEDIGKLALHNNVVSETLRLHAPIHSIMRAVKSPLSIQSRDPCTATTHTYSIPTSHVLLAAPGVTAHSAEYFPDPTKWEPRRWEKAPATKEEDDLVDYGYGMVSKGTSSPYLPFGAGRHRCIGEQFAYLQLTTIIALMVREFKFRTVDGTKSVPGTDYSSLFSKPISPAIVQWERRQYD